MSEARLNISFSYDPASTLFYGHLDNGARFAIDRQMIGGNLARNLLLFRDAVVAERDEKPFRPTQVVRLTEGKVKRYDKRGKRVIELEDLDL